MKKAVFFDIDGTLIDCGCGMKEMSPAVKQAIRQIQANGDYALIASGRPYAFLSQAIVDFGFDGYVLANGAQVILDGETVYQETMDQEFLENILPIFEKAQIQYVLEEDKKSYIKQAFQECFEFYCSIGARRELFVRNYQVEQLKPIKIEMLCLTDEASQTCLEVVKNYPEYRYSHSIDGRCFEFYSKKISKATGIHKVLEILNLPIENSYAFGDGDNDLEMLGAVGCGIAMGNASDYVKQHANVVTDTVHNDGVAIGIERFIEKRNEGC